MLCSYNWLKEFISELPPADVLAERLTMSGTEVEGVTDLSGGIQGVVTAEVLIVDKHPNADKLKFCKVKTDSAEYSIVCGASNMKAGDRVVLALNGATLPGGVKIKKSKIRGVESQGMMCSEVELGLADTSAGIMILPENTPLGVDIAEALGLKDFVLDVGVTPNRADLLSVRGLAREIGAVTGAAFVDKEYALDDKGAKAEGEASVRIEKGAPCARYAACVISGVKVGPSPEGIARRLEAHGVRPVNNVVDITGKQRRRHNQLRAPRVRPAAARL
jgi:phenylalanyl-tRNA synthetase beta chain